jgi:hypothetical protein
LGPIEEVLSLTWRPNCFRFAKKSTSIVSWSTLRSEFSDFNFVLSDQRCVAEVVAQVSCVHTEATVWSSSGALPRSFLKVAPVHELARGHNSRAV